MTAPHPVPPGPWHATTSALCASLVGIGLARFGYAPLIPLLVTAGWFDPADSAYLGAANLAGYLAGALASRPLAARLPPARLLQAMMLAVTLSFFACAQPLPFAWFFLWRFVSGIAGGVIMVLAATTVLPHVPITRRGLAGGLIFMGVGLGVVASATLIPRLLSLGLTATWLGLGGVCLILTLAAWRGWPADAHPGHATPGTPAAPRTQGAIALLLAVYGLNAIGLVPHMVFLVDQVTRGLDRGIETGAAIWAVFGLGAAVGPVVTGLVGDRIGFALTLRLALIVQAAAVGLAAASANLGLIALSALVIGAMTPGIAPVVLGRIRELIPHHHRDQRAAWSRATIAFALGQAVGAYGLSALFTATGRYAPLFDVATAALVLALVLDLAPGLGRAGQPACPQVPKP